MLLDEHCWIKFLRLSTLLNRLWIFILIKIGLLVFLNVEVKVSMSKNLEFILLINGFTLSLSSEK